jgi:hemerythrin
MALLRWGEAFGVGNAALDADHRILIDLLNQLDDALETGQSRQVVGSVINALFEYTGHHFRREEAMLREAGYPALESHVALHHALEDRARDICDRWVSGSRDALGEEVLEFLKKWLTEHILGADKSYRPWIEGGANLGKEGQPAETQSGT